MRALAIDYGRKRIGLAVSDATGLLARPWKSIVRAGTPAQVADAIAREIETLAAEEGEVAAVVVGLPRRLSGEPNDLTGHVEALVRQLRDRVAAPIVTQDERLTSREADSLLARSEKDWRKRKPLVDAMAAALILQDYLDGQARPAPTEVEGEDL